MPLHLREFMGGGAEHKCSRDATHGGGGRGGFGSWDESRNGGCFILSSSALFHLGPRLETLNQTYIQCNDFFPGVSPHAPFFSNNKTFSSSSPFKLHQNTNKQKNQKKRTGPTELHPSQERIFHKLPAVGRLAFSMSAEQPLRGVAIREGDLWHLSTEAPGNRLVELIGSWGSGLV